MFKFIKNKINSFLNPTNTETLTTNNENNFTEISFPNTPKSKEESIAWKNKKEKLIFEDFHFWNKLQINNYTDNKNFLYA